MIRPLLEAKLLGALSVVLLTVNHGEPYDYEQGKCFWCGSMISPEERTVAQMMTDEHNPIRHENHTPECAYARARSLLLEILPAGDELAPKS